MCRRPIGLLFAAALIAAGACARSHHHEPTHLAVVSEESAPAVDVSAPEPPAVDFASQIRPILEQHCMPCHFEGGTMYASLPFDQPQTVHDLGTKLFTRIKDEDDQELIRVFLASSSADEG